MADLNVALILRLVDRLSAPARAAARAVATISKAERDVARASTEAAQAAGRAVAANEAIAESAGAVTGAMAANARAIQTARRATGEAARTTGQAAVANETLAASATAGARAADTMAQGQRRLSAAATFGAEAVRRTAQATTTAQTRTLAFSASARGSASAGAAMARGVTVSTSALGANTAAASAGGAAVRTFSASATLGATASAGLGEAMTVSTTAMGASAAAAMATSISNERLARSEDQAGRSAETAYRKFGMLERAQMRGRAAVRMMGGELDKLDKQLGRLAMLSLATEGMAVPAHALGHLVSHSVGEASSFAGGMTGFGITAEMSDQQMAPLRDAILQASRRYAIAPEQALETFAFTRRSGVFTTVPQIIAAGGEATKFQKLTERMGSPVTGEEAAGGAGSAVREYGFAATPKGVERYYAMIDAAEKVGGGMKMSDLLQYSRSAGGLMKAFGAGTSQGLADVLAGEQVSNMLAHTGAQAGINYQDMIGYITHKQTTRRFAKEGIDLPGVIQGAWRSGIGPNVAFVRLLDFLTHDKIGPEKAMAMGRLLGNQQAGMAAMANVQNLDKVTAWSKRIARGGAVQEYEHDVARATSGPTASFERYKVAQQRIQIAMGTILLPIASRVADVLERVATAMSAVGEKGGPLGKGLVFAIAGLAGLALGTVALGHAVMAIAAPILTMRFLFGKAMPLSLTAARGAAAGFVRGGLRTAARVVTAPVRLGWRASGAVANVVAAAPRAIASGAMRAARGAIGLGRGAVSAALGAPRAIVSGFGAATRAARSFGVRGMTAIGNVLASARGFSLAGVASGFRAAASGVLGFVRSGRLASMAMNLLKFSVRGVLVASGIGLLILAAGLIVEHWRGVVTFFQGFGRGFMIAIAPLRPALQPLFNLIGGVVGWIGKLFGGGKGKAGEDWSSWGEAAGKAVGGVVNWLAGLIGLLGQGITKAGEFWDRVRGKSAARPAAPALPRPTGAPALQTAPSLFAAPPAPRPPGTRPPQVTPSLVAAANAHGMAAGQAISQGVAAGVTASHPAIHAATRGAAAVATNAFSDALGIHSPSRVFAELGENTMQGFLVGVDRSSGDIEDRLMGLAQAAMSAARRGFAGAGQLAHGLGDGLAHGLGGGAQRLVGSLASRAMQAVRFFQSRGWSRAQSAGIAANMARESNLNPAAVNAQSGAYGVTQWLGARVRAFRAFTGRDLRGSSLMDQLRFTDHELRTSHAGVGRALSGLQDAGRAAALINDRFEINGVRGEAGRRGALAIRIAGLAASVPVAAAAAPVPAIHVAAAPPIVTLAAARHSPPAAEQERPAQRRPDPLRLIGMPHLGEAAAPRRELAADGAGGKTVHIGKVEQHFHGPFTHGPEPVDHRKLAQEMHRKSQRGLDAALHDGGDEG